MSGPFQQGDEVTWSHEQGRSRGTVKQIHKEEVEFEGRTFKGSEDDPVYIVESNDTGNRAAHKQGALERA